VSGTKNGKITDDIHRTRAGEGWEGALSWFDEKKPVATVQGYGTFEKRPWYFRAREGAWLLAIAYGPFGPPVRAFEVAWAEKDGVLLRGTCSAGETMTFEEAWTLIETEFHKLEKETGRTKP
jgi:hypothetical protein